MQGQRGSFLGFSFNNIHSSVIGITRTNGDRYETKLIPTLKDRTADKVSTDGQFFYGSTYQKREFTVNFAFEEMTESQMNTIKRSWNDKKIHDLIFDETPYKVYSAKITGNSLLKHLAFTEQDGSRVYRGEGSFVFTCYFPFARSRYEYQEDYTVDNIHEWVDSSEFSTLEDDAGITVNSLMQPAYVCYDFIDVEDDTVNASTVSYDSSFDYVYDSNLLEESAEVLDETSNGKLQQGLTDSYLNNYNEWIEGSKIPSNLVYGKFSGGAYKVFNAGDVPIPFKIWFKISKLGSVLISCGDQAIAIEQLERYDPYYKDYYIVFNAETNAIEGYDSGGRPTGSTYNYGITGGNFFLLPTGEQTIRVSGMQPHKIEFHYWYL